MEPPLKTKFSLFFRNKFNLNLLAILLEIAQVHIIQPRRIFFLKKSLNRINVLNF